MSLQIQPISKEYLKVLIDNPPMNLFDQSLSDALSSLIDKLEKDSDIKVVVFDSADPDYFISHLDVINAPTMNLEKQATGLSQWPDFAYRIERAPFIAIGILRGRARGVGSEFLQAMDMRFASKEKGILCQLEMGCGLIPGGGGMERLPGLLGKARALEVITSAEDYDATLAEKYGWINRAIPDAELDVFIERLTGRISRYSRKALATAKQLVNQRAGLPTVEVLSTTQNLFFGLLSEPDAQERIGALLSKGLQQRGEFERNLGDHL